MSITCNVHTEVSGHLSLYTSFVRIRQVTGKSYSLLSCLAASSGISPSVPLPSDLSDPPIWSVHSWRLSTWPSWPLLRGQPFFPISSMETMRLGARIVVTPLITNLLLKYLLTAMLLILAAPCYSIGRIGNNNFECYKIVL